MWVLAGGETWDPVLLAYAEAVAVMQGRNPDDPTSWVYQAAVHDMIDPPIADRFLARCQHNSWFFLPWHRSYLAYFEGVVRAAMADLTAGFMTFIAATL